MLVVSAPAGFRRLLDPLPAGAEIVERPGYPPDVVVLFVTTTEALGRCFVELAPKLSRAGGLWVAWPKKASTIASELTFELVQEVGLAAGLVDNKSCSIDRDWQGLRFVYRKQDRRPRSMSS